MTDRTAHSCPRCGGPIPNAKTPGLYPGPLSRMDGGTEVCAACGLDEALRSTHRFGLLPLARSEWFDRTGEGIPRLSLPAEAAEGV